MAFGSSPYGLTSLITEFTTSRPSLRGRPCCVWGRQCQAVTCRAAAVCIMPCPDPLDSSILEYDLDERKGRSCEDPRCSRFCSCQSIQNPQRPTGIGMQAVNYSIKSTYFHQFSTDFNRSFDLVRDQGVGGSNPLTPTIIFNNLHRFRDHPQSRCSRFCSRSNPPSSTETGSPSADASNNIFASLRLSPPLVQSRFKQFTRANPLHDIFNAEINKSSQSLTAGSGRGRDPRTGRWGKGKFHATGEPFQAS